MCHVTKLMLFILYDTNHSLKDTNHLLRKIKSLGQLPEGAILCTIVVGLV